MRNAEIRFNVAAYAANGSDESRLLGSVSGLDSSGLIEHVTAVHKLSKGIDLSILPITLDRLPATDKRGELRPIFLYRNNLS